MQDAESSRPDAAEQYASATHATNLRVETDAELRSAADVLMAAAWSPSRLGAALLRLHSEWDGTQHPRRMTDQGIQALAQAQEVPKDCPPERKAAVQLQTARRAAQDWHRHEMGLLLGRLKTLPSVREQLHIQADKWRCDNPRHVAASILHWWLDRLCTTCHGTKFEVSEGTGRQSGKVCRVCRGTGEAHIPCGETGRRMANYMDDAVNQARTQIRNRLRPHRERA